MKKRQGDDWQVIDWVLTKYIRPRMTRSSRPEFGDENVLKDTLLSAGFEYVKILAEEKLQIFKSELSEGFEKELRSNPIPFEGSILLVNGSKY